MPHSNGLLPSKLIRRFAEIGSQKETENAVVVTKFFSPRSRWAWYATEYDPATKTFYGLVNGAFPEFGTFSLDEIQSDPIHGPDIERALVWKEQGVAQVFAALLDGRLM